MTATASDITIDQAGFEAFLAARDEPDWLTGPRRSAWETFCELDWPAKRSEEWMRTDIRTFKLDKFRLGVEAANGAQSPTGLLAEGVELGGSTVSHNGQSKRSELSDTLRDQGVIFGSLEEVVREHGDLLKPHLMTKAFASRIRQVCGIARSILVGRFSALCPAWLGGQGAIALACLVERRRDRYESHPGDSSRRECRSHHAE